VGHLRPSRRIAVRRKGYAVPGWIDEQTRYWLQYTDGKYGWRNPDEERRGPPGFTPRRVHASEHQTSIIVFRSAMIAVRIVVDRVHRQLAIVMVVAKGV
jgi:hypothetical protein